MSVETNKALIRRGFEEGMNRRNIDVFADIIGADYINHNLPAPTPGYDGRTRARLPRMRCGSLGIFSANPLKHVSRSSSSLVKRQSVTAFAAGALGFGLGGKIAS